MIASFPMYDRPENAAAHDALWSLIRDGLRERGLAAPDTLDRVTHHMEGWASDHLVLGQICNMPWRTIFRHRVTLIGASDYGLPDASAGHYYSVFVVRADDPATCPQDCDGYRFAYNEPMSQSGWGGPAQWAAANGLTLNRARYTHAHRASLHDVAVGEADLAALDAITWRNLQKFDPLAEKVRVIGRTHTTPGMSFITAKGRDPAPYFDAIADAIRDLPPGHRDMLGLQGIVRLPLSDYDIPLPPSPTDLPH